MEKVVGNSEQQLIRKLKLTMQTETKLTFGVYRNLTRKGLCDEIGVFAILEEEEEDKFMAIFGWQEP